MEMALHRQLKHRFGSLSGGQSEVSLSGFRIDAIDVDGALIEVQSGALAPLRGKLSKLLLEHRLKIVKPVVISRRIVRRARRDGSILSARMSPKRGHILDVFEDLIGLIGWFPHPRLQIDVMEVCIDEERISRRRRPGYAVLDRALRSEGETVSLSESHDLWKLLPRSTPERFTTIDLAEVTDRSVDFARKIAYCLRISGAATVVGKQVNRLVYQRVN